MAILLASVNAIGEEVKLDVSANRGNIYLGESINLTVKVSGMRNPPEPDLSAMKNCKITLLGSRTENYQYITIINNRTTKVSFIGRVLTYQITPSAGGTFTAGPVKLNIGGRTISQKGPTIEVAGMEEQDDVFVTISASRESVLVDEPFEITLSIAIKRLKGRYAGADPLDPGDPPTLTVAFLDVKPIDGLEPPDINRLLQKHLVSQRKQPGFAVNNYTLRNDPSIFNSMFNFDDFMNVRKAKFIFDRHEVEKNGRAYFEYRLSLLYVPKEEGNYTFGPAEYKGKTVVKVDAGGHITSKHIFAIGPAYTVRVVPPPEEGRPPSFIGAIGTNLTVEASLDTQTCNVGDPLTLTLSVSGDFSVANIYPPTLSMQADITRNFRIYEDTVQSVTKDNGKEYVYTIRPIRSGTIELPPIEVSYYDAAERRYRTVRTKPIPVRANEIVEIAEVNIIDTSTNRVTLGAGPASDDILVPAPVNMDISGAGPDSLEPRKWHLIMALLGPLSCLLSFTIRSVRRYTVRNETAVRQRKAAERARDRLSQAAKPIPRSSATVPRAIFDALMGYLADRFDVPEAGLTPADAERLLREKVKEPELAERFCKVLERNFNTGYVEKRSVEYDLSEDIRNALAILKEVDAVI